MYLGCIQDAFSLLAWQFFGEGRQSILGCRNQLACQESLRVVAGYKKAAKNVKEQNYTLTLTYSAHFNLDCERMLEVQKGVHVR